MGEIVGEEELRIELRKQLQRAKSLDTNPALIMIKPENESLVGRLGEIMLEFDLSNVDFGPEGCPQFLDYVANYRGAIAIVLEKGGSYGAEILEQIKDNIAAKARERLGENVLVTGTSCYEKKKGADTLLAEAYKP